MEKFQLNPITDYNKARCHIFAEYSVESSAGEYARRNQSDPQKIQLDIYRGKMAEFMVCDYMASKGNNISKPDLEIYKSFQKSYDADLVCNNKNLHVKSHFVNKYYPAAKVMIFCVWS
jgi:hypothetical protein